MGGLSRRSRLFIFNMPVGMLTVVEMVGATGKMVEKVAATR
jgi:hypothetical protein